MIVCKKYIELYEVLKKLLLLLLLLCYYLGATKDVQRKRVILLFSHWGFEQYNAAAIRWKHRQTFTNLGSGIVGQITLLYVKAAVFSL